MGDVHDSKTRGYKDMELIRSWQSVFGVTQVQLHKQSYQRTWPSLIAQNLSQDKQHRKPLGMRDDELVQLLIFHK
uniref:Uncharacterized protein n=1 Tax=Physcomitrium patens TaxID=3218 RepID=A0A2K1JPE8_PHYPA|nr:hypothetical protein PHYPA_015771 [Physcomitrium patens]